MTQQSLYERIKDEAICSFMLEGSDAIDMGILERICREYDKRIEDLERTNELLSRSVLPDGHWAAPWEPDAKMIDASYSGMINTCTTELYQAMRDNYLGRGK